MRKLLLALACMALSSAVFAVHVNWRWDDAQITGWSSSSSAYMVYSSSEMGWQDVLSAAKAGASTSETGGVVAKSGILEWGSTGIVGFDNLPDTGTYFCYFALFDNKNPADADSYAIAQAGENGQVTFSKHGISIPGPGGVPNPVQYLDPTWLAGNYKAAPEPTALALLALGVAGVALRRRIR